MANYVVIVQNPQTNEYCLFRDGKVIACYNNKKTAENALNEWNKRIQRGDV